MDRLFLRTWQNVPKANGAIATGREQRLPVRREGQAGDILEMTSQFGFRISRLDLDEADDSARAACTTHGQSPAIGRKRHSAKTATVIGKCKRLPPFGRSAAVLGRSKLRILHRAEGFRRKGFFGNDSATDPKF